MNKFLTLISVFFLNLLILFSFHANSQNNPTTLDILLDSSENFFFSLEKGEYQTAWELLSEKSHKTIINDVYKATRKLQKDIKREDIANDFLTKGIMFRNYWYAFAGNFDSKMILEESRWEIGYISKERAEIIITYKKTEHPAKLKMFKENNAWKVGLVETFWTRKYR